MKNLMNYDNLKIGKAGAPTIILSGEEYRITYSRPSSDIYFFIQWNNINHSSILKIK